MIALVSYLLASLAFLVLTVLLGTAWRGRLKGLIAVIAAAAALAWALVGLARAADLATPGWLLVVSELVRNGGWLLLLVSALPGVSTRPAGGSSGAHLWLGLTVAAIVLPGLILMLGWVGIPAPMVQEGLWVAWLLQSIFGLLLVEQVYRNRRADRRWEIKHLCLGLGVVFAFDLFVWSDALLLHRLEPTFWAARGMVSALIVPLIGVSAARNPSWSLEAHVSRDVAFHSATLLAAGVYLMAMAAAGYYVRLLGGGWGVFLQTTFLVAAGIVLLTLLFSGGLRARLRLLVAQHFFSFKYDYRKEWLRFTAALAAPGEDAPLAVARALAALVESRSCMLWVKENDGGCGLAASWGSEALAVRSLAETDSLMTRLDQAEDIIDLQELRTTSDPGSGRWLPDWILSISDLWLILPLRFRGRLCGFAVLGASLARRHLGWEERALLQTASCQAASYVSLLISEQALARARQFEAVHRTSAYVAHDLKNLLAQQSLILSNAGRHRQNPEFLDDVIKTVESSVERMQRLMLRLRQGEDDAPRAEVALKDLVDEVIALSRTREPQVQGPASGTDTLHLSANRDRLRDVLLHLVQNAQEATCPDGLVRIELQRDGGDVLLSIEDDGVGMSPEFMRERLFRPFDSTKGLSGMGIGAFESREVIRQLGGELSVDSQPQQGSRFQIRLPLVTV
ncbi:integral membrane sensor signal transduction histidine kinase [Thiorhodococcus drewsii AZ1]|uniref:histidine kinase n=1 Tax=Thiorhodococcus drewsii AZ1 TaxID=765913 RepID=G2E618_9GAMM|nr:XrtA/PEP-CTERM system histidine kinase PrsK [Thiorhodococcus drewsii]EGV28503.1 integral membrane sensor signal transduction histidine kinase [Thiorhodococcus drewsii AZ1]